MSMWQIMCQIWTAVSPFILISLGLAIPIYLCRRRRDEIENCLLVALENEKGRGIQSVQTKKLANEALRSARLKASENEIDRALQRLERKGQIRRTDTGDVSIKKAGRERLRKKRLIVEEEGSLCAS